MPGVLGDIDCDGSLTPIDAAVGLGLFVGSIVDTDLPPPCNDPGTRLAMGDWLLDGSIDAVDASITLGIFVGNIDECDTPLGQMTPGLCPTPAPLAASSIQSFGLNESESSTALQVNHSLTVSIDTQNPIAIGQTGVVVTIVADEDLTVGSTDITLNWDVPGIQVDSAASSVLSSFVANIDNVNRRVATASASSGSDIIPAGTTLMTFTLTANEVGVYNLFITDGDGSAPGDLAGPAPRIPPVSISYTAVDSSLDVVDDPPTTTPIPAPHNKAQQACANGMSKSGEKVNKVQLKMNERCLIDLQKGKLVAAMTFEGCMAADRKGKLQKAKERTATREAEKCDPLNAPPPFAYTDSTTVNTAAVDGALALANAIFGGPPVVDSNHRYEIRQQRNS